MESNHNTILDMGKMRKNFWIIQYVNCNNTIQFPRKLLLKLSVLWLSYLCSLDAEPATCIIVALCQSTLLDIALVQPFYPMINHWHANILQSWRTASSNHCHCNAPKVDKINFFDIYANTTDWIFWCQPCTMLHYQMGL